MLEEFDLPKTFLRFFERLVWSAEVLALAREYLVAFLNLLDHGRLSPLDLSALPMSPAAQCTQQEGLSRLGLLPHPRPADCFCHTAVNK